MRLSSLGKISTTAQWHVHPFHLASSYPFFLLFFFPITSNHSMSPMALCVAMATSGVRPRWCRTLYGGHRQGITWTRYVPYCKFLRPLSPVQSKKQSCCCLDWVSRTDPRVVVGGGGSRTHPPAPFWRTPKPNKEGRWVYVYKCMVF